MIVLQVAGSVAILAAFGLAQLGRINSSGWVYLTINAVGSVALGVPALVTGQWGFVLLESAWLLISLFGIGWRLMRRPTGTTPAVETTHP